MACDQILPFSLVSLERGVSVPPGRHPERTGSTGARGTGQNVSPEVGTCESRVDAVELSGRHLNLTPSPSCCQGKTQARSRSLRDSSIFSGHGGLTTRSCPSLCTFRGGPEKGAVKRTRILLGAVALCPCEQVSCSLLSPRKIKGDRRTPVIIVRMKRRKRIMLPHVPINHVIIQ